MISYGQGPLGRIYERLRKRSWRENGPMAAGQWHAVTFSSGDKHSYYVRGVRDGLAAAEELPLRTMLGECKH